MKYALAIAALAAALASTPATARDATGYTASPSKFGAMSCKTWTTAKGKDRDALVSWLAGYLDGQIDGINDQYDDKPDHQSVLFPPIATDVQEMDTGCKDNGGNSIRDMAKAIFLRGHP